MNCVEVMELMQRHLDQDLSEQEEDLLWTHTEHCPDCAAMFERLARLSNELISLPKVVPAYSLVDAILPKLDQIDLQNAAARELVFEQVPVRPTESSVQPPQVLPWTRRLGRHISWKTVSGVVAAGLVLGLFVVTTKAPLNNQADILLQPPASSTVQTPAPGSASGEISSARDGSEKGVPAGGADSNSGVINNAINAVEPSPNVAPAPQPKASKPQAAPTPAANAVNSPNRMDAGGEAELKSTPQAELTPSSGSTPTTEPMEVPGAISSPSPGREDGAQGFAMAVPPDADSSAPEVPGQVPAEPDVAVAPGDDKGKSVVTPAPDEFRSLIVHSAEELSSPDAKLVAVIEDYKVVIKNSSGEIVFTSERSWKETDAVSLISWSKENKLTYQAVSGEVTQTFVVDPSEGTESAAP